MTFILTFAARDNLFNHLLFPGGILFYYLGYSASPYITHTLSAVPGLDHPGRCCPPPVIVTYPWWSFPIPSYLIFVDTCLTVIPNAYSLSPPAIFTFTLLASNAPYSPPHNPGGPPISHSVCLNSRCHMCLTILRKA